MSVSYHPDVGFLSLTVSVPVAFDSLGLRTRLGGKGDELSLQTLRSGRCHVRLHLSTVTTLTPTTYDEADRRSRRG